MGKKTGVKSVTILSTADAEEEAGFVEKVKIYRDGRISARFKDGRKESSVRVGEKQIDQIFSHAFKVHRDYRRLAIKEGRYPAYSLASRSDGGIWGLRISFRNGREFRASYGIGPEVYGCPPLSRLVRKALKRDDLFLLDGQCLDVTRVVLHIYQAGLEELGLEERLVVDFTKERAKMTVSDPRIGETVIVRETDDIEALQDMAYHLTPPAVEKWDEEYEEGTVIFVLSLDSASGAHVNVAKGTYDKTHLPGNWGLFMDKLDEIMPLSETTVTFDDRYYEKRAKRPGDYTYCEVTFGRDEVYCYLSDIDVIYPGQYVRVPVGAANDETVAYVENVFYGTKEEAPYPFERLKHILGFYKRDPHDFTDIPDHEGE